MKTFLATLMLVALTTVTAYGGDLMSTPKITVGCPTPKALEEINVILKDVARDKQTESYLLRRLQELNCEPLGPQNGPFEMLCVKYMKAST
jgi:hypothetical protein